MKSISRGARTGKQSPGCTLAFAAIFIIAGLAVVCFFTALPVFHWVDAAGWEATPCTIQSSAVESHRSDDGTTYSIEITYSYELRGTAYTADRYDFFNASSSGRSGKETVVRQYPPGAQATCYVNPSAPAEAVLNRDFQATYLVGLFGLLFVAAGCAVAWSGLRKVGGRHPVSTASVGQALAPPGPAGSQADDAPLVLESTQGPLKTFLFLCFFATFWNGITWFFVITMLRDGAGIFPLAFISIFVLLGLGVVAGAIRQFLAIFNPRVRASLRPGTPCLGADVQFAWTLEGSASRIRRFEVTVEGRETARYRQGTNTRTATSVFERIPVCETEDWRDMASGAVGFTIPEFTMHSFQADNNRITWHVKVRGDIPRWPDMAEEFEIKVGPLPKQDGR